MSKKKSFVVVACAMTVSLLIILFFYGMVWRKPSPLDEVDLTDNPLIGILSRCDKMQYFPIELPEIAQRTKLTVTGLGLCNIIKEITCEEIMKSWELYKEKGDEGVLIDGRPLFTELSRVYIKTFDYMSENIPFYARIEEYIVFQKTPEWNMCGYTVMLNGVSYNFAKCDFLFQTCDDGLETWNMNIIQRHPDVICQSVEIYDRKILYSRSERSIETLLGKDQDKDGDIEGENEMDVNNPVYLLFNPDNTLRLAFQAQCTEEEWGRLLY